MKNLNLKSIFAAAALLALGMAFPASGFAQKRTLEREAVQNFIRSFPDINKAFGEMANPAESRQVALGFDDLAAKFYQLAYTNSEDISAVRKSYQKLLGLKAPSFDKVFSRYGVKGGYRAYITIFTGVTICLFGDDVRRQTREWLNQFGFHNDEVNATISVKKRAITQLQALLAPSDMELIEDNKILLLACFGWK